MILASPEFDTYGSLRRFAECPDSMGLVGFRYLLIRCERQAVWSAIATKEYDRNLLEALSYARVGTTKPDIKPKQANRLDVEAFEALSPSEQVDFYVKCLDNAGTEIDREALVKHLKGTKPAENKE